MNIYIYIHTSPGNFKAQIIFLLTLYLYKGFLEYDIFKAFFNFIHSLLHDSFFHMTNLWHFSISYTFYCIILFFPLAFCLAAIQNFDCLLYKYVQNGSLIALITPQKKLFWSLYIVVENCCSSLYHYAVSI